MTNNPDTKNLINEGKNAGYDFLEKAINKNASGVDGIFAKRALGHFKGPDGKIRIGKGIKSALDDPLLNNPFTRAFTRAAASDVTKNLKRQGGSKRRRKSKRKPKRKSFKHKIETKKHTKGRRHKIQQ